MSQTQVMENFDVKDHKKALFSLLAHVLNVSKQKFDMERASNRDRQSWGRLIVGAIEAYGKLLESVQLDELEERLKVLEEQKK